MELGLKGKVAIVTGGASGIGKACVEAYSREGANVMIGDIQVAGAEAVAQENMKKYGNKIKVVKCDITRKADAENLAAATLKEFGAIDILLNNAGIGQAINFIDVEEKDFDLVFNIDVKGVYLVTRAVLPHMMAKKSGKIVNIASQVGKEAVGGSTIYSAAKFAVMGLTQGIAKEMVEYNINVNAVCPGIVPTHFYDAVTKGFSEKWGIAEDKVVEQFYKSMCLFKRPQPPEEIAAVVIFLSSEVTRDMTGQGINVTGGAQMH